jgi:hypothetical protein
MARLDRLAARVYSMFPPQTENGYTMHFGAGAIWKQT